jgi:tRNA modification GTPase
MFAPDDTIVAVATPPGRGGLGVVRLSGPDAQTLAISLLDHSTPLRARHATLSRLVDASTPAGDAIDQVVATSFPGPGSYTGDDVVEISAHGSPVLLERIVALACAGGARLAEPGEFTLRAYLNGRLDLVQAEAVADLVDAVTPLQARIAFDQLEGTVTQAIGAIDADLFDLIARLEASLDFPNEGYHFVEPDAVEQGIGLLRGRVLELLAGSSRGRLIREGCQVVILGKPNVGKSSVFNALVGSSRAIVTAVAGTTRDLVSDVIDLDGVAVTLVDSAGIRATDDAVEAEGVARAQQALAVASAVVVVLDRSAELEEEDRSVLEVTAESRRVLALNKMDVQSPSAWSRGSLDVLPVVSVVEVSASTGQGLDMLRAAIRAGLVGEEVCRDTPTVANQRHIGLLERARGALADAERAAQEGASEEFVLADLQRARSAFEELTGVRTPDDVVNHIFERFCIGK